jgi:hypothetical protein
MTSNLTRLRVNLNAETAQAVRDLMAANEISATEVTRRAISLMHYVEEEVAAGRLIYSKKPGSKQMWEVGLEEK